MTLSCLAFPEGIMPLLAVFLIVIDIVDRPSRVQQVCLFETEAC